MTLAEELKAWRAKLGLTQAKAANRLQVSLHTYRGWEGGKRRNKLQAGPIRKLISQIKPRRQV